MRPSSPHGIASSDWAGLFRRDVGRRAGDCAVPQARAGMLYRFRLDGGDLYPDPVSRSQPEGPHGPSQIIDPGDFAWTDAGWPGVRLAGQVVYELHVGTFTPEGTWEAAERQL